jgi:hypothetical protein
MERQQKAQESAETIAKLVKDMPSMLKRRPLPRAILNRKLEALEFELNYLKKYVNTLRQKIENL